MKILIKFFANVTEKSVNDMNLFIIQQIAQQNPTNPASLIEEIIIEISSSGGSSDHGLLAYNSLKQISVPITTIGMGNVDSAAVLIYAAGMKRLAMPSCRFVLHQPMATIHGEFTATKLKELGNITERIKNDYCKVVVSETGSKKNSVINKLITQGKVLSSDEAIKYKLSTEIINKPYLEILKDTAILMINNPVQLPNQTKSENKSEQ